MVPNNNDKNAIDAWPSSRLAWWTVSVLLVAYTFSFIDRTILALLVEPIKRDLHVTDTQVSLLHGFAFAIFYTLMGLPIGRWADHGNRKNIITLGVIVWSLMTAACGLTKNFWTLFLARVGVGVGEAALSPSAYSMIADYFPPQKIGRALGVYSAGVYIGGGLAFIIGGAVVQRVSGAPDITLGFLGEVKTWQLVFFAVGLPGLVIAALTYFLREPSRRGVTQAASGKKGASVAEVVGFHLQHARVYVSHYLGFALLALVFNAVLAWAPSFMIRTFGATPGEVGLSLGLSIGIAGGAGIVFGGWLMDRMKRPGRQDAPLRVGMIGGLGTVPFIIVASLAPTMGASTAAFFGFMFFAAVPYGAAAAALQLITPNEMRAQSSAVYLLVLNLLGIGLGPLAVALFTDYVFVDPAAVGLSMAIVSVVAGVLGSVVLVIGFKPFAQQVDALANAQ